MVTRLIARPAQPDHGLGQAVRVTARLQRLDGGPEVPYGLGPVLPARRGRTLVAADRADELLVVDRHGGGLAQRVIGCFPLAGPDQHIGQVSQADRYRSLLAELTLDR